MEEITASEHLVKSVINELLDPEHELSEDETFKDILEQNINNNHNEYIVGITKNVETPHRPKAVIPTSPKTRHSCPPT